MSTPIILAPRYVSGWNGAEDCWKPCQGCGDLVVLTDAWLYQQADFGKARPMCARCVLNRPGVRNVKGGGK